MNENQENADEVATSFGGLRHHSISANEQATENKSNVPSSFFHQEEEYDDKKYEKEDEVNKKDEEELLHFDQSGKPFKCMKCGKRFSLKANLRLHLGTHTDRRPFVCPHDNCGKKFTQSCSLKSHICTHINRGDCSDDILHYLKNHSLTTYECGNCGRLFTVKLNLERHIKSHSNRESLKDNSKNCTKMFAYEQIPGVLRREESKERPFSCPERYCSKTFTQRSGLNAHICNHMQGINQELSPEIRDYLSKHRFKTYACDICKKKFTQKYALDNHILTHTGEKQFVCKFTGCTKSFLQKSYLDLHTRIHSNDRPYVCKVMNCAKAFTRSCYLNSHLLTHGFNLET